jgi:hypothetical protein
MRWFQLILTCLGTCLLAACAGYRMGPTNGLEAGSKSVRINPFMDQTFEPRLGEAVTTALRRNLQHDATFRLSTHGESDIVVNGVITKYIRQELSLVPTDVLTVRDFRVTATAQVTARNVSSGEFLVNAPVTGYTLVRAGPDLASAEREALPMLADDLARKVIGLLSDGSW